jgi:hypothetical protein
MQEHMHKLGLDQHNTALLSRQPTAWTMSYTVCSVTVNHRNINNAHGDITLGV